MSIVKPDPICFMGRRVMGANIICWDGFIEQDKAVLSVLQGRFLDSFWHVTA